MRSGRKRRSGNQRPPSRRERKQPQQKQPARTGALSRTGAWIAGVAAAVPSNRAGRMVDRPGKSFTANSTSGPAIVVNPDRSGFPPCPKILPGWAPGRGGARSRGERLASRSAGRGAERAAGRCQRRGVTNEKSNFPGGGLGPEGNRPCVGPRGAWTRAATGDPRRLESSEPGALLAAAGVVVSVVIGFFATDSSSVDPLSGIPLLVGFVPAVLAVKECWLVLHSLDYDDYDTDLTAYENLKKGSAAREHGLRTVDGSPGFGVLTVCRVWVNVGVETGEDAGVANVVPVEGDSGQTFGIRLDHSAPLELMTGSP